MLNSYEATFQRSLTEFFIQADPNSIVLEPMKREPNGSGGYVLSPQPPRDPQVMRLIPISTTAMEQHTLDGRMVKPEFVLQGTFDCGMERGDRFTLLGKRYEVVHIQEKRDYQTKGETVLLGDA